MADDKDKPISAFEYEGELQGNEFVPIVANGANYKTQVDNIRSKLAEARKIWGQPFDGTADVNGTLYVNAPNLAYAQGIRLSSSSISNSWSIVSFGCDANTTTGFPHESQWTIGRDSDNGFLIDNGRKEGTQSIYITPDNKIGIGTKTPREKLDVNGNFRVSGKVSLLDGYIEMWRITNTNYHASNIQTYGPSSLDLNPYGNIVNIYGSGVNVHSATTFKKAVTFQEDISAPNLETLEFTVETLNTGLGEVDEILKSLSTTYATKEELQADKTNLANFKQHVEADFVKDVDYNKDKEVIVGQIMNKVDATYVNSAIDKELNAASGQLEVLNDIKQKLDDNTDIANAITESISDIGIIKLDSLDVDPNTLLTDRLYRHGSTLYRVIAATSGSVATIEEIGAKEALFIDIFNRLAGSYGKFDYANAPDKNKPYYLNELWLSYQEAIDVVEYGRNWCNTLPPGNVTLRTNILACQPGFQTNYMVYEKQNPFFRFTGETARVSADGANFYTAATPYNLVSSQDTNIFQSCPNLRKILGSINIQYLLLRVKTQLFTLCPLLEEVNLVGVGTDTYLGKLPKLCHKSLRFLVDENNPSGAITVTVHTDIYNVMTGVTDGELNGGTAEQWRQLLSDAVSKNISFASA